MQDRIDGNERVRRPDDDHRRVLQRRGDFGGRCLRRAAVQGETGNGRGCAQTHEVILKRHRAIGCFDDGRRNRIRHWQDARPDPERPGQCYRDFGQPFPRAHAPRALHMHGEIPVTEEEPVRSPKFTHRGHETVALVLPSPALRQVGAVRKGIDQRVDVGADAQAQMVEVVAGVGDDRQVPGRQHPGQSQRQLGPADTAGQIGDPAAAHRNRSISGWRTSSSAVPWRPASCMPRTITTGTPSAPCPMTREAAAATSSAMPSSLACSSRPSRSI